MDGINQCSECLESDGYIIKYNYTCYKQCAENTKTDTNNEKHAYVKIKWYKYIEASLNKEIIKSLNVLKMKVEIKIVEMI